MSQDPRRQSPALRLLLALVTPVHPLRRLPDVVVQLVRPSLFFPSTWVEFAQAFRVTSDRSHLGFKQLKRFSFIFIERITLRIPTKAHDGSKVFKRWQMLAPFCVNRL
jgi:hypothetical protein